MTGNNKGEYYGSENESNSECQERSIQSPINTWFRLESISCVVYNDAYTGRNGKEMWSINIECIFTKFVSEA